MRASHWKRGGPPVISSTVAYLARGKRTQRSISTFFLSAFFHTSVARRVASSSETGMAHIVARMSGRMPALRHASHAAWSSSWASITRAPIRSFTSAQRTPPRLGS